MTQETKAFETGDYAEKNAWYAQRERIAWYAQRCIQYEDEVFRLTQQLKAKEKRIQELANTETASVIVGTAGAQCICGTASKPPRSVS